jgi:zinc protease
VTFDAAEVDKERGVVIEEWRLGQGAGERLRQQYFPVLFRDSRYAARLPIGQKQILETFPRAELMRFYRDLYRPELMAVIAVGDFDAKHVEQLIRNEFSSITKSSANSRARAQFEVPDHAETLVTIATDREATGTSIEIDWKLPPRPAGTVAAFRASLATSLYTSMLNARLSEIAQKANPPFIGAGSSYGSLIRTRDIYSLGASVQDGGIERALDAILTEAERVARHGFTATELERQKTNLLRAYERAHAERDKTESSAYAGEYVDAFLENEPIPGIAWEYEQAQRLVPGVTLTEVNAFARQWMSDRSRVVIVTAPEKADVQLPGKQALVAVIDAVAGKQIGPYQDIVAEGPLVASPPTPGRITARDSIAGIGTELLTLSNGVRVVDVARHRRL